MSNVGVFSKTYVKQVKVIDLEGNEVEIVLKYSARTPLLYLNMFGTDMFDDLADIVVRMAKKEQLVNKVNEKGVESITEKDLNGVDSTPMFDFFNKFGAALIATAHYPKPLAYDVIMDTMLPQDFILDEKYSELFEAVKYLFAPATEDYKKKLTQAVGVVGKRT